MGYLKNIQIIFLKFWNKKTMRNYLEKTLFKVSWDEEQQWFDGGGFRGYQFWFSKNCQFTYCLLCLELWIYEILEEGEGRLRGFLFLSQGFFFLLEFSVHRYHSLRTSPITLSFHPNLALPLCACMLSRFSRVPLFGMPWTVTRQAPLSMGFSKARILE